MCSLTIMWNLEYDDEGEQQREYLLQIQFFFLYLRQWHLMQAKASRTN